MFQWPSGLGVMATSIRAFDWSSTSLGPIADWPQSLKTTVDNMLCSGHAMMLAWGPERTILYNDAYAPMMGDWHPAGLGLPLCDAWPDVWDEIAPLVERVFEGETVRFENMPLITARHGDPEQSWWTFSYSPVRNEAGMIAGLLNVTVDATAQVRAEAALRESEAKYRLLFDGIDDGFCVLEVLFDEDDKPFDYKFIKVNPAFERQNGLHDAIGKTMLSMAPQHERFWIETYGRIVRTGRSERFDNRADALGRWYEVAATPIGEPGENQVAVVFRDVLQRRKAEEALRESDARHRLLIGSWSQATWETDPGGVVVADSPSWRAHTGQTLEEWLGYGWLDAIHPDDRAYAECQWREAMAARGLVDAEYRLRAPDGGWRWTNVRAAPVLDATGGIEKWAAMNIDIDARKRAEAALRESEEKYRSLFDSIDEGFTMVELVRDPTGRPIDLIYREFNQAFERLSGLTPAVMNRGMTEVLPHFNPDWFVQYARVAETGMPERSEEYLPDLDRWNRRLMSRIGGPGSPFIAVVFDDITDLKRAETVLRESEERQAFLLKLSDAVRPLADAADIQGETTRLLRQQLAAGWCYYVDWELNKKIGVVLRDSAREGLPSLAGAHDVSDAPEFLQVLGVGAVLAVHDYANYEQLSTRIRQNFTTMGFRSMMAAPLVKEGRLIATLLVGDTEIRDWSASETSLLVEAAERTWAAIERGHAEAALRESEELRRVALDSGGMGSWRWDRAADLIQGDEQFMALWGLPSSDRPLPLAVFAAHMSPQGAASMAEIVARAVAENEEFSGPLEIVSGPTAGSWVQWQGRAALDNPSVLYGVTFSITEQKRAADALRVSEARLAHDLEATQVLQTVSNQLISKPGVNGHFDELCEAARTLMRSDCASIQAYDEASAKLKLVGHVGFHPDSAASWEWVDAGVGSTCGQALAVGARVIVPDIDLLEVDLPDLETYRRSAILSVQSTPLVARTGQIVGMMSTHWNRRNVPPRPATSSSTSWPGSPLISSCGYAPRLRCAKVRSGSD